MFLHINLVMDFAFCVKHVKNLVRLNRLCAFLPEVCKTDFKAHSNHCVYVFKEIMILAKQMFPSHSSAAAHSIVSPPPPLSVMWSSLINWYSCCVNKKHFHIEIICCLCYRGWLLLVMVYALISQLPPIAMAPYISNMLKKNAYVSCKCYFNDSWLTFIFTSVGMQYKNQIRLVDSKLSSPKSKLFVTL